MPVPSDETTWMPIVQKMFSKKGLQQLPLEQAVRALCRRGVKQFGRQRSDKALQNAVDRFIRKARSSGSLVLKENLITLPEVNDGDLSAGNRSKPAHDVLAASGISADTGKQHPAPKTKRKRLAALDSITDPKEAQEGLLTSAPAKAPVKKKKPRKPAMQDPALHASADEAQGQHQPQTPADGSLPAEEQKPSKKAREPTSEDTTGARVGGKDTGSMPGIPGVSAAEVTWKQLDKRTDVKRGRFSEQEKATIIAAAKEYARAHGLSDTDLSWIYNTRNDLGNNLTAEDRTQRKGAWLVIAQALPHRTPKSVWAFATRVLHEGNHMGKWSAEDTKELLQLQAERGNKWKEIGAALGRQPEACRIKHRDLLLGDAERKGKWSSEEEAKLVALVTQYIEERPAPDISDGRNLIDAVSWDVISQLHGTRAPKACRQKWYDNLAPSMVSRGDWGAGDDRRLLKALYRAGHSQEWQVDWGTVVPERSAVATKRRWRLMLKSVPGYQEKEFAKIVEELVSTHLPALKSRGQQGTDASAPPADAVPGPGRDAADKQAASG